MENEKKQLSLLLELENTEQFQTWRDLVAQPILDQLESDISNADNLSEVVLRAKLKHLQSVKYLFYQIFEVIKAQKKLEQQ